ncbi:hypothetical protein D3C81_1317200 [compost metagenome]
MVWLAASIILNVNSNSVFGLDLVSELFLWWQRSCLNHSFDQKCSSILRGKIRSALQALTGGRLFREGIVFFCMGNSPTE